MRRALPVLAATGGALALLANFHSTPEPSGVVAASSQPPATPTQSSTASTTSAGVPVHPVPTTLTLPTTTSTASTTTTLPAGEEGIDGPIATNKWGDVQVRVIFERGQIVDVQALKLPDSNSHSVALSTAVQRRLRQEALQAQSADIDTLSGATLTSDNYIDSLQGALDRRAGR